MSFGIVQTTLASAVADAATVAVAYPAGMVQADFTGIRSATGHAVVVGQPASAATYSGNQISVSFGSTEITVTNSSGVTWAAGSPVTFQFDRAVLPLLTDNSGGTAAQTIAAIGGTYSQAEVRNAIASLAAAVNLLTQELRRGRPARDF